MPRTPMYPLDARWADRLLLKGYDVVQVARGHARHAYWERYGRAGAATTATWTWWTATACR